MSLWHLNTRIWEPHVHSYRDRPETRSRVTRRPGELKTAGQARLGNDVIHPGKVRPDDRVRRVAAACLPGRERKRAERLLAGPGAPSSVLVLALLGRIGGPDRKRHFITDAEVDAWLAEPGPHLQAASVLTIHSYGLDHGRFFS